MNSWNDHPGAGWWRISSAWWTSAVTKTRFFTPRSRSVRRIRSRSVANPRPASGAPSTFAFDQESRRSGLPVGTESGTLVTTTFHTAADVATLSTSQRRWAPPSIVLPGPSGSVFGLRYWRVSRMKTSTSRPQRNFR